MVNSVDFTRRTLMLPVALLALHSEALAAAKQEAQPISTASVNISVSVAANYRVQHMTGSVGARFRSNALPGDLCLASNSAPMALPIWWMHDGVLGLIDGCGPAAESSVLHAGTQRAPRTGLVLVIPE